jgi:hypothetical protein
MSDWDLLRVQILELVGDPSGSRYTNTLLVQAGIQAMRLYNNALPQIMILTEAIIAETDEVVLDEAQNLMSVIHVGIQTAGSNGLHVSSIAFTWSWANGLPFVRFPQPITGTLRVIYTASHNLAGLGDATVTTVPSVHHSLFSRLAAACAMQMRAELLREAYGQKSSEAQNIQNSSEKMLQQSQQQLDSLRYNQSISPEWGEKGWEVEAFAGEE